MSYQPSEEVVEAARRAWNKLEGLFATEPEFYEPDSVEFTLFYDQLLQHLLAEEQET